MSGPGCQPHNATRALMVERMVSLVYVYVYVYGWVVVSGLLVCSTVMCSYAR